MCTMNAAYFVIIFAVGAFGAPLGDDAKIHDGQYVKQGEYPFVVAFKRPNYTDCAGTILTKDWVLTGGGCCFYIGGQLQIYAGSVNLNNGGTFFTSIKKVLHPWWEESDDAGLTHPNDICLVQLEKPLKFNKRIQPVKLPPADYIFEKPTQVSMLGWGAKNASYWATSDRLNILKNLTAYPVECPLEYQGYYPSTPFVGMMCASTNTPGYSPCNRDEGGPLLYNDKIQIGFFSYSNGPTCEASKSSTYVSVSHYIPWIQAVLGESAKELIIATYQEVPCRFTYCSPWFANRGSNSGSA